MAIENLFPIPVGFYRLGRNLTKKEIKFITDQERRPNNGNSTSSDTKLLLNKELTDIREFIEDAILDYFKIVYESSDKVFLYITQSWANYTEPGQYHHKHTHPNSFISGIFYPQAERDVDKVMFFKSGFKHMHIQPMKWNSWNSESWWFSVGSGDLILFPSSLEHMVETKQGNNTRISLSFNTFPKGHLGVDESLTGLHLGEQ